MIRYLIARALLAGCQSALTPRPALPDIPRPQDALLAACDRAGPGQVELPAVALVCDRRGMLDAHGAVVDLWLAAETYRAELARERTHGAADRAVGAGQLASRDARIGQLESQRWIWGAVGVGVGALLAGLIAGLAR
ncbi:MAG: hypothetical protein ABIJ73_10025 [Pseudomonadota bacterium]